MQIPALREYILVDATSCYVQCIRKQQDGSWKFKEIKDTGASLHIHTIQHQIALQEIYTNVKF